jgi:hypothetical protein
VSTCQTAAGAAGGRGGGERATRRRPTTARAWAGARCWPPAGTGCRSRCAAPGPATASIAAFTVLPTIKERIKCVNDRDRATERAISLAVAK